MRNYVENRGVENEKLPCAESTLCGKAKRVLVYVCKFFLGGGGEGDSTMDTKEITDLSFDITRDTIVLLILN